MISAAEQFRVSDSQIENYAPRWEYQFGDLITGRLSDKKQNYRNFISNAKLEQDNLSSARAWEEYLASNKYQLAVKDLEKAGLNPWLAVQNGLSGSGLSSSVGAGNTSAKVVNSTNSTDLGKDLASIIGSALKILMLYKFIG